MKKTSYRNPQVELINSFDEKLNAWVISRPYLNHESVDIKSLEKMDLPLNGFAHYVLKFTSSLYFRDLLFTLRPSVIWARSQRTVPINTDNAFISGEYESTESAEYLQGLMNEVYDMLEQGVPQDYAKKHLPMAFSTEFTISIDDRTLVTFIKLLKLHSKPLYEAYGKLILEAIGKTEDYIDERNTVDIFNKLKVSDTEREAVGTTQEVLELFVGSYKISNNLMSQFIRQHYSTIKNELFNKIEGASIDDLAKETCETETIVVLYADKASFKKVLSVRSCWFAQFDEEGSGSWSSIVGPYVKDLSHNEFLKLLPCRGNCNNCGIRKDMEPRLDCIEVNPPCPILIQNPAIVEYRKKKYNSSSTLFSKWEELKIKDNPNNVDRIRYEKAIEEVGLPE